MEESKLKKRRHHYLFAHVALRQQFFSQPLETVLALNSGGPELLEVWWQRTWDVLSGNDSQAEKVSSAGLRCSSCDLGENRIAAIVTLPEPQNPTEAYFVAAVVGLPRKRLGGLLGKTRMDAKYVTLEYGMAICGDGSLRQRTVLCEWTESSHLNLGDGPAPELAEFIKAVSDRIDGKAV